MNDLDDARQWDEVARHLVRAHGARPRQLIAYALPLSQFRWVHFDTHAALEIAQVRPPDGHVHPALPDPGRPGQPYSAYRPFPSSPTGRKYRAPVLGAKFTVTSECTGLPQTGIYCGPDADLTGRWSSLAVARLRAHIETRAEHGPPPPWKWESFERFGELLDMNPQQAPARFRDDLRHVADAAAARWLARVSFPAPPARSAITPARAARQPGRQVSRRARGR